MAYSHFFFLAQYRKRLATPALNPPLYPLYSPLTSTHKCLKTYCPLFDSKLSNKCIDFKECVLFPLIVKNKNEVEQFFDRLKYRTLYTTL